MVRHKYAEEKDYTKLQRIVGDWIGMAPVEYRWLELPPRIHPHNTNPTVVLSLRGAKEEPAASSCPTTISDWRKRSVRVRYERQAKRFQKDSSRIWGSDPLNRSPDKMSKGFCIWKFSLGDSSLEKGLEESSLRKFMNLCEFGSEGSGDYNSPFQGTVKSKSIAA